MGIAKINASTISNIPPRIPRKLLEFLLLAILFKYDSDESPNWQTTPIAKPHITIWYIENSIKNKLLEIIATRIAMHNPIKAPL